MKEALLSWYSRLMTREHFKSIIRSIPGWFDPHGTGRSSDKQRGDELSQRLFAEMEKFDPHLVDMLRQREKLEQDIIAYIDSRQEK